MLGRQIALVMTGFVGALVVGEDFYFPSLDAFSLYRLYSSRNNRLPSISRFDHPFTTWKPIQ